MTTPDPTNWTNNTVSAVGSGRALQYANNRWLYGGVESGGNTIAYASGPEGPWTGVPAFSAICEDFAYGGNVWVAVGQDSSNYGIKYSINDGLTWLNAQDGNGNPLQTFSSGLSVAYNGTGTIKWVAVGEGLNGTIYHSTNGINWTAVTPNPFSLFGGYVTYANGKWVAVGRDTNGQNLQISSDGQNWTAVQAFDNLNSGEGSGLSVAYGSNGNWAAVGVNTDGANNIYYSNDNGDSWIAAPAFGALNGSVSYGSIAYGNGIFVATLGVNTDSVYRSTDGTGQQWVTASLDKLGFSIQYSNDRWVVAGFSNVSPYYNLAYSSNGSTWTKRLVMDGATVSQVRYGNGKWVAIGQSTEDNLAYSSVQDICFLEGSKILTDKGYVPVEQLKVGDMVKTVNHGFVAIQALSSGKSNQLSLEKRLDHQMYVCPTKNFPEAFEDLVITGFHSILVKDFPSEEEKKETQQMLSGLPITDGYYLLPSRVDRRTEIYDKPGTHNIYHVCLECVDDDKNYGIYANGILVESISKNHLLTYGTLKVD